jgi:hypothetical protein
MSTIKKEIIELLINNPTAEVIASSDMTHTCKNDPLLDERVFSSDLCDVTYTKSRDEIVIVFGMGDNNYSNSKLLGHLIDQAINDVLNKTSDKKVINKERLKKQLSKNIKKSIDSQYK